MRIRYVPSRTGNTVPVEAQRYLVLCSCILISHSCPWNQRIQWYAAFLTLESYYRYSVELEYDSLLEIMIAHPFTFHSRDS
jgi:hypothetical protein